MGGSNANLLEEVRATKRDITTAHTTFTTHFNTFLSLAEELEIRLKEVEGREGEVEKRENKLKGADQQYEERERRSLGREREVEERERTVIEMEARWKETEKRMEANTAKLLTIIKLNISMLTINPSSFSIFLSLRGIVSQPYSHTNIATISVINSILSLLFFSYLFFSTGGTKFSVLKEKLLQHKGSLFEEMIVSNHAQQLPSGEYVSSLPIDLSNSSVTLNPCSLLPFPFLTSLK